MVDLRLARLRVLPLGPDSLGVRTVGDVAEDQWRVWRHAGWLVRRVCWVAEDPHGLALREPFAVSAASVQVGARDVAPVRHMHTATRTIKLQLELQVRARRPLHADVSGADADGHPRRRQLVRAIRSSNGLVLRVVGVEARPRRHVRQLMRVGGTCMLPFCYDTRQ